MGRNPRPRLKSPARRQQGLGQLSLVEHALCPLDPSESLQENSTFEYEYHYTDPSRHQQTARARVICPAGMSATDDFFLWGLLALTLSQSDADGEFHATPHYCLRRLGLIDQHARRGGRQYRQFSDAVERLSLVRYRNDAFYDPIRAEHRRVSFGFLSYSLPLDPRSCRAWRIAWDPIFFELVKAVGGHLRFDLESYRKLDPASRRLFLFVSKVFARRATTPTLDLRHLAVNIMGFRSSVATKDLKQKVIRAIVRLEALGIVKGIERRALFAKHARGQFRVVLHRGPYFDRRAAAAGTEQRDDSALHELLYAVGLDEAASARMVRQFPLPLLREWADITLAAKERFGEDFFTRSQQAYFVDNVKNAAQGKRTPPDWWQDLRTAERLARRSRGAENGTGTADDISTGSREVLDHVRSALQIAVDDNTAAAVIRSESADRQHRTTANSEKMPVRAGEVFDLSSFRKQ